MKIILNWKSHKKEPQENWKECLAVRDFKGLNYLVRLKVAIQELGEALI